MALASSTTTAAALTVRLDPELVAPSLQPSKPWTCCCTLDRPEKKTGRYTFCWKLHSAAFFALGGTFSRLAGTWCTRRVVLVLVQSARACGWRGIRKLGAAGGAEGCMRHSFRPAHHCRLELDQSGLLRLLSRSLLFSVLNIGLVLMIDLPHGIQFELFFNQPVVFRVLAPKKN